MPRFAPALFATFFSGLLLLFIDKLDQGLRSYLLPSLLVYAQGAALIGTFNRLLGFHFVDMDTQHNNEKPIPIVWKVIIWVLHLIWFAAFVIYLFYRDVL